MKEITCKKKINRSNAIKRDDGTVLMETEEVMERWEEYIRELFDDDRIENLEVRINEEGPSIIKDEVENAIRKMKTGKLTGEDEIAVEMLVALEDYGLDIVTEIVNGIYESGEIGPQMYRSTFIPIPKNAGTLDCNKHRTISIMNHITKILLKVILNRIRNKILPEISNEQCGFMKGKGTRNAIFILRSLMERVIEVNKKLYICFVDFEKAFDKVKHEDLIKMLEELELDGKDLRLIKNLYWKQEASVRLVNGDSKVQSIKRGVRQGCVMSPDLYNFYAEMIMRELRDLEGIKVGGENVNNIRYADDTALVADSCEKLQNLINSLDRLSKEKGLNINMKKTKVMVVTKDFQPPKIDIKINNHSIDQVEHFNYLGSIVTSEGRCNEDIKRKIVLAKKAFNKIRNLVTNSKISMEIRKRFIKCYVWSVLLYGCETWTMSTTDEKKIEAVEMWCHRRMLKLSWTERKTNEEVLQMASAERNMIATIRSRQMRFLGHIMRRGELEDLSITGKLDGKRPRGRPRFTYIEKIRKLIKNEDHQDISANKILQSTRDQTYWKTLMAANVHNQDTAHR